MMAKTICWFVVLVLVAKTGDVIAEVASAAGTDTATTAPTVAPVTAPTNVPAASNAPVPETTKPPLSGQVSTSKPSTTAKPTTTTKDPVLAIDNAIMDIPTTCKVKEEGKNCASFVDDIKTEKNLTLKCSFTSKLDVCVSKNCTNASDVQKKVDEMNKICNGACLITVSTMLVCFLAMVFRVIQE